MKRPSRDRAPPSANAQDTIDTANDIALSYEQIIFEDLPEHDPPAVRVHFERIFNFDIPKAALLDIGLHAVSRDTLYFEARMQRAASKFEQLLSQGFLRMHSALTGRRATYIHRQSGIPLIGSNEFGVVDRGSNIIEVKPITGCNLRCIYCSVSEGKSEETMGWGDYIVEEQYLVEETAMIAALKEHPVEINIGPQGEPLLYPEIVALIRDLHAIKQVKVISINTNGVLLTPALIDELCAAGLTRINLSINAMDQELAQFIADRPYNLKHILDVIAYAKTKMAVLLAPVIVPGVNEGEMPKLIELAKQIKSPFPTIGFQNFLNYKNGRNPAKAKPLEEFFDELRQLERAHGHPLLLKTEDNPFKIYAEAQLPKPFRKDDIVHAIVGCLGRHPGEMIAVAQGRTITVIDCDKPLGASIAVRIVRDKHNIFKGILVKGKGLKGKDHIKSARASKGAGAFGRGKKSRAIGRDAGSPEQRSDNDTMLENDM